MLLEELHAGNEFQSELTGSSRLAVGAVFLGGLMHSVRAQ